MTENETTYQVGNVIAIGGDDPHFSDLPDALGLAFTMAIDGKDDDNSDTGAWIAVWAHRDFVLPYEVAMVNAVMGTPVIFWREDDNQ